MNPLLTQGLLLGRFLVPQVLRCPIAFQIGHSLAAFSLHCQFVQLFVNALQVLLLYFYIYFKLLVICFQHPDLLVNNVYIDVVVGPFVPVNSFSITLNSRLHQFNFLFILFYFGL